MKYSEIEIKDKLLGEFISLDKSKNIAGDKVEAIVLFAAEETSLSGENKERIETGIDLKKITRSKCRLIYLGTRQHNQNLRKFFKNNGVEISFIQNESQANTLDQIRDLQKYLSQKKIKKVILISHLYHIPRIKRYCKKYLEKTVKATYWSVGRIRDQKKKVEEEIEKIIEYAARDDLALFI